MTLLRIDERLPDSPLACEVVLHVRRHARAAIHRRTPTAHKDLALLFGFELGAGADDQWREAAQAAHPLQAGAAVARKLRSSDETVVPLGYDANHIAACRRWLMERKASDDAFDAIAASDLAMLLELSKARDIACARAVDARGAERYLPVLIQGPTGSGKELLALAIHALWTRGAAKPKAPFEVVHVGGMSADMINDELFGHAPGAYTGAKKERAGRLEAADGGTLLIDEVGDLPPEAQVRLLRFLQTQVVSRIGENTERQLSVRVIAATWHDLDANVASGKFREDLLHRLQIGAGLRLPSLANREGFFDEVLPMLLERRRHRAAPLLTRSARDALARHSWPGNLRELTGVIDEVVDLADGGTIRLEHLPSHIQRRYIELPLHERALGFLLDEVDGGGLPDEHVVWRIEQVNESLAKAPRPQENEQLATVGQFLTLLDDSSDEHRRTVTEVQELLRLDQEQRSVKATLAFWKNVLDLEPPANVKRLVRAAAKEAAGKRKLIQQKIVSAQKAASIESNPWLRLFREVHALPFLRGTNTGELAKAFVATFNMLKLIAPSLMETVREDALSGGFNKIRERFVKFMRDSGAQEDETDVIDVPTVLASPSKWSRSDWESLAAQFPTQRAAVDATGFDPKTISKYLKRHGIPNPWKAERSS